MKCALCSHQNVLYSLIKMCFIRPALCNSHQQFRLEPAQAFPGFFKLVSVHHPDRVIRFCPALMPNLQLKQKEPGSPNQAWRIDGGRLHPKNHPNMFISINRMTGKYHVDPQMQAFDIMHVM